VDAGCEPELVSGEVDARSGADAGGRAALIAIAALAVRDDRSMLCARTTGNRHARTCTMGRGDIKSRQGKIFHGSHGKRRPKSKRRRAAMKLKKKAAVAS
jgi:ribosomal small subunit protein bTHX